MFPLRVEADSERREEGSHGGTGSRGPSDLGPRLGLPRVCLPNPYMSLPSSAEGRVDHMTWF